MLDFASAGGLTIVCRLAPREAGWLALRLLAVTSDWVSFWLQEVVGAAMGARWALTDRETPNNRA